MGSLEALPVPRTKPAPGGPVPTCGLGSLAGHCSELFHRLVPLRTP